MLEIDLKCQPKRYEVIYVDKDFFLGYSHL